MAKQEKKYMIEEIARRLKKSQSVFVTDFRGLKAIEVDALRGKLEEADSDFFVVKNTLAKLALKDANLEGLTDLIGGSTSLVLVEDDPVKPAKFLIDFSKAHEKFIIKGGYVVDQLVSSDGVKELALLPSKQVLLAKVVGGINAPVSGLVFVLSGILRGFVCALNQIKDKAESDKNVDQAEDSQEQQK